MELLIGCGSEWSKRVGLDDASREWIELVTCDVNPSHNPDVVADLNIVPWPWKDEQFAEVHAYEVLEHLGHMGNAVEFFETFSEIWRILEPDGLLCATVPSPTSPWWLGDPSHTRVIHPATLTFLQQSEYEAQVGVTAMSDFRHIYSADFEVVWTNVDSMTFSFILRAKKAVPLTVVKA